MFKYFHMILAIAFLSANQNASAAEGDVQEKAQVPQVKVEQVHRFLEKFIDPDKTPAEHAEFFADSAQYYDQGVIGKARIAQDVKYHTNRWPWRFYRLEKIDSIIPDPDSDRTLVRYGINFEVAQPAKTIAGKAYYIAVIADLNSSPKIEKIEEIITRRQFFSTLKD